MEDPRPQEQPDGSPITYAYDYDPMVNHPPHSPWCECSACTSE